MEVFLQPETWIALATLTFLEIVLGIDNIIFITIAANKLPEKEQGKARNIGLVMAMILRLILLLGISLIYKLNTPLFGFDLFGEHVGFTGQSLILLGGGLFLIYKATTEIHHKLEGEHAEDEIKGGKAKATLQSIIIQICLINIVFSFDSILTAVGLIPPVESDWFIKPHILQMMIAVIISVVVMMFFAGPVGRFVNNHPTVQMLGLSFLILIGFMLIAEGAHHAHLIASEVPKGYLYFAIFFSLSVEFLNMKLRKKHQPVELKNKIETD